MLRSCQTRFRDPVNFLLVPNANDDLPILISFRQEFQREVPDFRLFNVTGQFKMFNSAMIAGISAIIEPRGPDSDQMR